MTNNNLNHYILENVSEEDYAFLKGRETHILEGVRGDLEHLAKFTPEEMTKFVMNKPSFEYNKTRKAVGIFLNRGSSRQLVLSEEDIYSMSASEIKAYFALRNRLGRCLEGKKIRGEDWK
jgi:hypothetical protein